MTSLNHVENLEEGSLYVYKKGILEEIVQDHDDQTKKIRVTSDAFSAASEVQKRMRQTMSGFRPDMTTICSALLKYAAESESATHVVRSFALQLYQAMDEGDDV